MTRACMRMAILAALATTMAATPVLAQKSKRATTAAAATRAGALDADSTAALDRMGAYLRSIKSFQLVSTASTEDVYANGQKLQFLQRTTYTIGGPSLMHVKIETDEQKREVFYNGTTFTILAPRVSKYIQLPATGTNGQMLTKAYENWGVDFPVQDLFRWGDASATAERPKEGFKVGTAMIGEHMTDHYAFRQTGVDWQIWIDQGDKPLPRKMVIVNTDDAAMPEYVAYFTWDMAPTIASGQFEFKPANTDTRIDLKQFAAATK